MAGTIRFERMVHITMYSGFQVRHNKPLCQVPKLIIYQNYQQLSNLEYTSQLPQQLNFLLQKNNNICYTSYTAFSKYLRSISLTSLTFTSITYEKLVVKFFLKKKLNLTNLKMYAIIKTVIK